MWRRVSNQLYQTLIRSQPSDLQINRSISSIAHHRTCPVPSISSPSSYIAFRQFSSDSDTIVSKGKLKVEDVMPIATGHEREELEAELEGRDLLDINHPASPLGTKVSLLLSLVASITVPCISMHS
ncbi:hypothetical protein ACHQM5_005279 [Ranunculus cassubicifolius]